MMCSERTFTFSIKDCGASVQPNCNNIKVQTANNRITISGLDGAPNSSVSVTRNGRNTFNCRGNCKGTETVRVGSGKFQIKVTYFNKSMKQLCTKTAEFNNNNLVGTSSSRSASPSDNQIATEATIPSGAVSLSVYPNPANTSLTIDATSLIGKKGQLSVMNPFGQVINQFDLGAIQDGTVQLDVSTYQAGLYLISASLVDGEQFLEKVIIK